MQPFDVETHNGTVTVTSLRTGEHRTLRIRTEEWADRDNPEVKNEVRTVGLLSGPDNTSDYRNFALIGNDCRVILFKKHRGSQIFEWLAKFVHNPVLFMDQVEINFEGRCRKCNRPLTTPESVASGIGPVCKQNTL